MPVAPSTAQRSREDTISVYNNWYIAKAKKFEVKATATDKDTITLELNAYDVLKLDATPEQWEEIIGAVGAKLGGSKKGAPRKRDDDY